MTCRLAVTALFSLAFVSFICASPKIEINPTTYQCGSVPEGTQKLKSSFTVKNTGDSVLHIINVRPGCGCTVVHWDSLVEPGKTSVISADVNIKNYHSGQVNKSMTVTSNAKNSPTLQLTISAKIEPIVDYSPQNITFAKDSGKSVTITLTSKMKELNVKGVSFTVPDQPAKQEWQKRPPEDLRFSFKALDSTMADGYRAFRVDIYPPVLNKNENGEINIKLNHPEKDNVVVHVLMNDR